MPRNDQLGPKVKTNIRRDPVALAVHKTPNEQVVIVLLGTERKMRRVQIARNNDIPPIAVSIPSSIWMRRAINHVHPSIAFKNTEFAECSGVADTKLHCDHVGECVCDLLVSISANDTNKITIAQAVFADACNCIVVEIPPEGQCVVKTGGSEMVISDMLRPPLLSHARYMLCAWCFVLLPGVKIHLMPAIHHHAAKAQYLARIGAG